MDRPKSKHGNEDPRDDACDAPRHGEYTLTVRPRRLGAAGVHEAELQVTVDTGEMIQIDLDAVPVEVFEALSWIDDMLNAAPVREH